MKYFVIHGHFYQPYRVNPYLGDVLIEESAYPFDNWNERIYRECYLPNAYAHYREGYKVKDVINNYERLSFNMGWTLLHWLSKTHPELLEKIREGSKNAIATSFNHTILPLDSREDKEIQIRWGIRVFEKFFGRKPRGFWLPELAVDKETIDILIRQGIKYVILAPHQVKTKGNFLRYFSKEGHIDVFVYDGELSHGVAFGDLLVDARLLLDKLSAREGLTLIATDGETFGHHKKFGEMGLAYLFKNSPHFTSLEEYYDKSTPRTSTDINENTSWSCPHGVERWRSDCGCSTGGLPGWHQKWRKPLREGLEAVRSRVKEVSYNELDKYFHSVEEALWDFVDTLIDLPIDQYLERHLKREVSKEEKVRVLKLLNAIKYAHLSFSSDGWFFADISGIESVNNLLFAKKAIDLLGDETAEKMLLRELELAPSNVQSFGNGLGVWRQLVLPKVFTYKDVARTAVVMHLSELKKEKDYIGHWEFEVLEMNEVNKLKLKDLETGEEFLYEESPKEFEVSELPSTYLKTIFEKWAIDYMEEEMGFMKDYKFLLEDMVKHSKTLRFSLSEHIKEKLREYLKTELLYIIKKQAPIESIREVFEKAEGLDLEVKDEHLSQEISKYVKIKVSNSFDEKEIKEILRFIREYDLRIDLWEVQNLVWERRREIKDTEIFELLELSFSP